MPHMKSDYLLTGVCRGLMTQVRGVGGCLPVALLAIAVSAVIGEPTTSTRPAERTQVDRPAGKMGFEKAFFIPIQDEINEVTLKSIERRIDDARKSGADLIIFDLDTPGGEAFTALKICTAIKNLSPIHTVAWINPDAYSAGAIIALACNEVVMSARSKIGDCKPIMIGPEGGVQAVPEDVDDKFTSPLIEELKDSSNRGGYDMQMLMSMIRSGSDVFWVENGKTGERRFVRTSERNRLFGLPDMPAPAVESEKSDDKKERSSGRRLLDSREPISDELSKTDWRYVKNAPPLITVRQPVVPHNELLTMGQDEAIAYGFARAKVSSESELRSFLGIRGPIERLEYTKAEDLVGWLSSPAVRSVLFILMLLAAYVAFNVPGMGLPEIVAATCLLLFLGAPYLTGLANAWEIIVVVVGIGLLFVELFVVPGFGLIGLAGGLLILIGLLATFVPAEPGPLHWPRFGYTMQGVETGLWVISLGLLGGLVGMVALSRVLPRSPYFRRIVPDNPTPESVAILDPQAEVAAVGSVGLVEGILRPAGKARFGSSLVDVVSDGEFINAGERVEVIDRKGNQVVVRRVRRNG